MSLNSLFSNDLGPVQDMIADVKDGVIEIQGNLTLYGNAQAVTLRLKRSFNKAGAFVLQLVDITAGDEDLKTFLGDKIEDIFTFQLQANFLPGTLRVTGTEWQNNGQLKVWERICSGYKHYNKVKQHYHLWQWIEITLGVLITAAALSLFMVPNKIAGGGVSGFATVVHHVTGLPVGLLMILCNVPLFWLAFRRWGVQSVARSLYGSLLLSLFVDGISLLTNGRGFVGDPFLAALYGGVLAGIGMGFVFRGGGTTGGTDLLARLLQRNGGLSLGHTLLLVDGCVILLALFFFDIELALYALIAVFITGKMVDVIQEGLSYAKAVLIISESNSGNRSSFIVANGERAKPVSLVGGFIPIRREKPCYV